MKRLAVALVFLGGFVGALALFRPALPAGRQPDSIEVPEAFFERDLDRDLGEQFEGGDFDHERKYVTRIVNTFLKIIRDVQSSSPGGEAFRGAHARALACLKGEFEVRNSRLPQNLRVGVFAEDGAVYRSWIRLSNGSQDPLSADNEQNARGFAVKLVGVGGEKLIGSPGDSTLDLVHIPLEAFVVKDGFNYPEVADGSESLLGLAWRLGWSRTQALLASVSRLKKEPNPLRLDYFSTVPYRLGHAQGPKQAIKFRLTPCDPAAAERYPVTAEGPRALAANIAATLTSGEEICYDFQVQPARPQDRVEDATTRWTGEFVTAGRLRIPAAVNPVEALAGRAAFCEGLSFNPWRTLDAHRPLGRINRARKTTYLMSSLFRHQAAGAVSVEPGLDSFDRIP